MSVPLSNFSFLFSPFNSGRSTIIACSQYFSPENQCICIDILSFQLSCHHISSHSLFEAFKGPQMLFQGAIPGYFETKLRFEVPIEIRTPNTESQKTKIYTSLYLNHYKSESKHIVKPTIKNIEAVGWLVTGRHRHPTSNVQALNGQRNHKAHFNTQSRTSWSRFLAYKGTFPLTRARIGGLISLYLSW